MYSIKNRYPGQPYRALNEKTTPSSFKHLPPEIDTATARNIFLLGMIFREKAPADDCLLYAGTFAAAYDIDQQIDRVTGIARETLSTRLRALYHSLEALYTYNASIIKFRKGMQP